MSHCFPSTALEGPVALLTSVVSRYPFLIRSPIIFHDLNFFDLRGSENKKFQTILSTCEFYCFPESSFCTERKFVCVPEDRLSVATTSIGGFDPFEYFPVFGQQRTSWFSFYVFLLHFLL